MAVLKLMIALIWVERLGVQQLFSFFLGKGWGWLSQHGSTWEAGSNRHAMFVVWWLDGLFA